MIVNSTFVLVLFCAMMPACGPDISRSAGAQILPSDQDESVRMLNSAQVVELKRLPHERAIIGLQRLSAIGEYIGPCGAVLIRSDVILSAAHCFDPALNKDLAYVRAQRSMDLKIATDASVDSRAVRKFFNHPLYKSREKTVNGVLEKSYDHDMAVAILDRPYDADVRPQPLANADDKIIAGQTLTVYGFGRAIDYAGVRTAVAVGFFSTLQRGSLTMSGEFYFDRVLSKPTSKSFLCDGDSGGPAFSISKDKKIPPVVVAISSAQSGRQMSPYVPTRFCQDAPALLQPVGPFRDWIDSVLKQLGRY